MSYALKITKASAGVATATIIDQVFNSDYTMLKYHSENLGTITVTGGVAAGSVNFTHGLGYTPAFISYYNFSDSYGGTQFFIPGIPGGVDYTNFSYAYSYADSTKIQCGYVFGGDGYNSFSVDRTDVWYTLGNNNSFFALGKYTDDRQINGAYRVDNVALNKDQAIDSAVLSIYVNEVGTGTGNIVATYTGIDEDDTADFSGDPMGRPVTSAIGTITIPKPSPNEYVNVNVKSQVQEIIGRAGWSNGNAIGFIFIQTSASTGLYFDENAADEKGHLTVVASGTADIKFRTIIFKDKIA